MTVTEYYWDELSDNVLMEADENGDPTAVYTNEPGLYGELISQERGGEESFYHFDGQGSTRQLTDDTQTVTDEYTYTAFGETVVSSGVTVNPFGYVGQLGYQEDLLLTTVYVRARMYIPNAARWISVDPQELLKGGVFYIYSANEPVVKADPSGRQCEELLVWNAEACSHCPPCTCDDVHGTTPLSPNFPIAELGHEIAKDTGFDSIQCTVRFALGNCGFPQPGAARTCGKGDKRLKREIFICIQSGVSRCGAQELLVHELVHAKQLCNQGDGSEQLTGECKEIEKEAYKQSCPVHLNQQRCMFEGDEGYREHYDRCVDHGVAFSCVKGPQIVTKTCDDIIREVFGGGRKGTEEGAQ